MKKVKFVLGLMVVMIMLGGWSPLPPAPTLMSGNSAVSAAEGDPELVVNNLTGTVFYMTMTGPQTYSVQVASGKNTYVVEKGLYSLSYFACGAQQTKEVNVKKNGGSIKLTCEVAKGGKSPKLTVDNKANAVYITLTGPKFYSFYAPGGKTSFDVEQGTYEISYFACGTQIESTVVVKKKGLTLKIQCFTINVYNYTDGPVEFDFSGPGDYYFYMQPGKTTILLHGGTYDVSIETPCWDASGTIKIKKNESWGVYCN